MKSIVEYSIFIYILLNIKKYIRYYIIVFTVVFIIYRILFKNTDIWFIKPIIKHTQFKIIEIIQKLKSL